MLIELILASALAAAAPPLGVAARAGEEVIGLDEVAERLADARGRGAPVSPERIAEQLVAQALLAIDARRAGLSRDPEVARAVERARRRALADLLVERELAVAITDAELRELYHQMSDAVELDALVLATEEEARAAAARLARGAALADEARGSLDPEGRRRGGNLGRRTRAQLDPALAAAAFGAPPGAFEGPVKLALGHALFRVRARRLADDAAFAAEREPLRRFAEQQARGHVRARYVAALRARSGVKLDDALLASAAADAPPEALDRTVARVGAAPVRVRDVDAEIRLLAERGAGHSPGGRARIDVAWAIVDRLLLEEEAARALASDASALARARAAEREALAAAWVERERGRIAAPLPAEVEVFHRAHRADWSVDGTRRCWQIVTGSRDAAEAILERLSAGEGFEDLARRFSLDPATRGAGGLVGEIADARLEALAAAEPEVVAAVRGARPGRATRPARSAGGWHVFRCERPVPPRVRPLAEVRDEVVRRMSAERLEEAIAARVGELRREITVEVERGPVARLGSTQRPEVP